jgi:hypothetical protein
MQDYGVPRIILISPIAEILGKFAHTLMVGMGSDNARRAREGECFSRALLLKDN